MTKRSIFLSSFLFLIPFLLIANKPTAAAAQVEPSALISGIGMIVVALGFVLYAALRRLGWGYLLLGAMGWGVTVALKFAWAIPANTPIYEALIGALPEGAADIAFYIYVGALTGIFEVALIWPILYYTKLGRVDWNRVMAFGLGFGAVEALLLGLGSLTSIIIALTIPETLPADAMDQLAVANNPLFALAPVSERFFIILVHLFTNVLLFYGASRREWRWFWLAFAYKTGIDIVGAFAQFWGLEDLGRLWLIEGIIIIWGVAGWLGTRWVKRRYQTPEASIEVGQPQLEI